MSTSEANHYKEKIMDNTEKIMDNTKKYHKELQYSISAGTAYINLVTGRLRFVRGDVSVGIGARSVGVSHVYNSMQDLDYGVGKGWLTTMHETLAMSENNYLYIDSEGIQHELVPLKTVSGEVVEDKYYDKDGLGLIMTKIAGSTSECVLTDDSANEKYFSHGKLMKIRLCISRKTKKSDNKYIDYHVTYSGDRLIEVYAEQDKKINYEYQGDILTSITVSRRDRKKGVRYTYQDGKLVLMTTIVSGAERDDVYFEYAGDKLTHIVSIKDKSYLHFEYDEKGRVSHVQKGVASLKRCSEVETPVYEGETQYAGESHSGHSTSIGVGYELDNEEINVDDSITYFAYTTSVTNKAGVESRTVFNELGMTLGAYEVSAQYKGAESSTQILTKVYTSLLPSATSGIPFIRPSGQNFGVFDSMTTYWLTSQNEGSIKEAGCQYAANQQSLAALSKYATLGTKINVSFWVYVDGQSNASNFSAKMWMQNWSLDDENFKEIEKKHEFFEFPIKNIKNEWQYVSREFTLKTAEIVKYAYVTFYADKDFTLAVSPPKLNVYSATDMVDGVDIKEFNRIVLDGTHLDLVDVRDVTSDEEYYITANDVAKTIRNMALNTGNGFDVVLNDGCKRIAGVGEVKLKVRDAEVYKTLTPNNADNYIFYTQSVGKLYNTLHKYTVYAVDNGVPVLYNYTKDADLDDSESAISYTIVDMTGRMLESVDEHGVKRTYLYDDVGEVVRVTRSHEGDADVVEKCITRTIDGDVEIRTSIDARGVSMTEMVDTTFGETLSLTDAMGNRTVYDYDVYGERIRRIDSLESDGTTYDRVDTRRIAYNTRGRMRSMAGEDDIYTFSYDDYGNVTGCDVNGTSILGGSIIYNDDGTTTTTVSYPGEDTYYTSHTDKYGRVNSISADGQEVVTHTYRDVEATYATSAGRLLESQDGFADRTTTYHYNVENSPTTVDMTISDGLIVRSGTSVDMGGVEYQEKLYTEPVGYVSLVKQVKDDDQEVVETTLNTAWTQLVYTDDLISPRLREMRNRVDSQGAGANLQSTEFSYDDYGRVSKKTVHQAVVQDADSSDDVFVSDDAVAVEYTYTYENGRDNISAYSVKVGNNTLTETIARDCLGRITSISRTDGTTQYVYDKRGRLVSDGDSTYTYDNDGNILTKGNLTYTYGNSNRLTGYGEYLFAYDQYGNPTHYKVSSLDTSPNMTWSRGRQLVEYGDVSYRYDANRIRVAKETDSYRYEYITNGEHNVTAEYHYDKARQEYVRMINYVYNGGTAESMVLSTLTDSGYTTSRYYLVYDVHGNVSRLLNPDCTLRATYHYDSWGKCTVFDGEGNRLDYATNPNHIAFINPFRYRGYYYDDETGLYYLQTRYYDPDTGRFVSPDTPDYLDAETTGGLNLYAYCLNDPINYYDPTGHFLLGVLLVVIGVCVVATTVGEVVAYNNAEETYEKYKDVIEIEEDVIYNSAEVSNLFDMWALAAYVRYYTDSKAKGSSYGLFIEWMFHNVGHSVGMSGGEDLNFGETILSDFEQCVSNQDCVPLKSLLPVASLA